MENATASIGAKQARRRRAARAASPAPARGDQPQNAAAMPTASQHSRRASGIRQLTEP